MLRPILATLISLILIAPVAAQRCLDELHAGLDHDTLKQRATGQDAARLLARAVHLLEPALPQLEAANDLPVDEEHAAYTAARFLAERKLLPSGWHAGEIEPEVWQEMLARLAEWYELEPDTGRASELSVADAALELSELIGRVNAALQPVAFVASHPSDRERIGFWAVVRNDSVYPRMIIVRPPEPDQLTLHRGVEQVLGPLGTCAAAVDKYVYAPAETATRLFLAHNDSRMVVVESDAPAFDQLYYVPQGEETEHLAFEAEELEGADRYAAVFVGPPLGIAAGLRIIPQLRTNMGPREILAFLTMD